MAEIAAGVGQLGCSCGLRRRRHLQATAYFPAPSSSSASLSSSTSTNQSSSWPPLAELDSSQDLRRAAEVYPLFDDVVFRDPISAERCKTLCAARFAADAATLVLFQASIAHCFDTAGGPPHLLRCLARLGFLRPIQALPLHGRLLHHRGIQQQGDKDAVVRGGIRCAHQAPAVAVFRPNSLDCLGRGRLLGLPTNRRTIRLPLIGETIPCSAGGGHRGECRRVHWRQVGIQASSR